MSSVAAIGAATLLSLPIPVHAATIQLTVQSRADVTAEGLAVHIDVRNTGDAPAYQVTPIVAFYGQETIGTFVPEVPAGGSIRQSVTVPGALAPARGSWPLYIHVPYADAGGHPFEAVHVAVVSLPHADSGAPTAAAAGKATPVTLRLSGSRLWTTGEVTAHLESQIAVTASLRFVVPAGLGVAPEHAAIFLEPGSRQMTVFVTNAGATNSSRLPVFAVAEYESGGRHETAIASAFVDVVEDQRVPAGWLAGLVLAALLAIWGVLAFGRQRRQRRVEVHFGTRDLDRHEPRG